MDTPDTHQSPDATAPAAARRKRRRAPQARLRARSEKPEGLESEDIAPAQAGAQTRKRAPHNSRNGPKASPPAVSDNPALPAFEPVPRKFRHDGWTPDRQKAFIGALADTGCVTRAARYVNMSPEGAYRLRRQAGSDSFRRAWEGHPGGGARPGRAAAEGRILRARAGGAVEARLPGWQARRLPAREERPPADVRPPHERQGRIRPPHGRDLFRSRRAAAARGDGTVRWWREGGEKPPLPFRGGVGGGGCHCSLSHPHNRHHHRPRHTPLGARRPQRRDRRGLRA